MLLLLEFLRRSLQLLPAWVSSSSLLHLLLKIFRLSCICILLLYPKAEERRKVILNIRLSFDFHCFLRWGRIVRILGKWLWLGLRFCHRWIEFRLLQVIVDFSLLVSIFVPKSTSIFWLLPELVFLQLFCFCFILFPSIEWLISILLLGQDLLYLSIVQCTICIFSSWYML